MGVGMIANHVSAGRSLFQEVRAFAGVLANYEKCGAGFEAIQEIEQLGGDGGVGPVIERKSELARRIGARNGPAKQLRAGIDGPVGSDACRGSCGGQDSWSSDQPVIHWVHSRTAGSTPSTSNARLLSLRLA